MAGKYKKTKKSEISNDTKIRILELKYSHSLNKQSIFLGFIGAIILSIVFLDKIPIEWGINKSCLISFLAIISFLYYIISNKELENIIDKIKNIK